ncbi:PTS sugar transporter subunit IIA [Staphylococcus coagulans]|uniref:PTS sugar transporter subunit IIA n=1 Tax=Staphylococcus coagulans TaxID=74706 RepID=UPI001FD87B95|nr:PTS glucose transporter subunit IIA [Staphylococcus coagulans]
MHSKISNDSINQVNNNKINNHKTENFNAVTTGSIHPIEESTDPAFRKKMMGEGYFIIPTNEEIFSPVSGTISTIFPTKHAIGITTANGLEVLLHMGINTVELNGLPFEVLVTEGQKVTTDSIIAKIDLSAIKEAKKIHQSWLLLLI